MTAFPPITKPGLKARSAAGLSLSAPSDRLIVATCVSLGRGQIWRHELAQPEDYCARPTDGLGPADPTRMRYLSYSCFTPDVQKSSAS